MSAKSVKTALPAICRFFENNEQVVYQKLELSQVFQEYRDDWQIAQNINFSTWLETILAHTSLRQITLRSDYTPVTRYTWNDVSPYLIAMSLKTGAYLSHGSAVFLHGLNDQIPKVIYLNKEQSKKPPSSSSLTQEAINRAFANKQRRSKYVLQYSPYRWVLLSGKNAGNLGVSSIVGWSDEMLDVTNIERTLVDIAVRPAYAGGVYQVLAAYEGARGHASAEKIEAILKNPQYKYPYHQSIGFYMERAGFSEQELSPLKELGLEHDFYLDYGMAKTNIDYNDSWRLFHPKGF